MTTGVANVPVLTLLTRAYCHLCDEMRAALEPVATAFGMAVVELDVDADAELEARYGERVPVLLLGALPDAVELCHFRFDRARVERALQVRR